MNGGWGGVGERNNVNVCVGTMLAEQKEKGERCFSNLSMTSRMWDLPPTVLNILIKVCFGNKTAKVKKKL